MQNIKNIKSIRRSILITVLGFVFVFVSLAILYIANTFLEESKQHSEQSIVQWASYLAKMSVDDLRTSNKKNLAEKLTALRSTTSIHRVDFYLNHSVDNKFGIEVSYNNITGSDYEPSTNHISSLAEKQSMLSPVFDKEVIKFIAPININDSEFAFIYIEMDSHTGLSFTNHLFIIFFVLLILLIAAVFSISFKLEQKVSTPLKEISATILQISQSKDYSLRVTDMPYKEADIIAKNINNFLNRTERHITQLGIAEQQSLSLNIELEDKVTKRTQALKESNQELLSTLEKLHQFQDQLVESEKMASLGDMVAGVAHEVNTPIGLGVTASTLLSDRMIEIKTAFEEKTLKSSQLKKFLDEGEENVGIVYRNLKRAAELISSFKKVAVDQSSDEFRKFNFVELLNEILLTLAPQIKKTPYQIDFDCPPDLDVVSKPGPINQIIINLILNSITHGFDGRDHGSISVNVLKLGEQLHISYKDDGKGIAPSIKDKIFEPFTTTKRGEGGSGLGLHLVYNLVTQALGGNIRLDSEPYQGASFEISFPISEQLL